MKKIYTIVSLSILSIVCQAQVAPNFTLTDIEGESHTLYEYLDAGQTVVLDFYAVWCGPCQANASGVENVYLELGPDGSNDIMILGIEADDSSTDEEVAQYAVDYDCSNPQINNSENVADLYGLEYYPTYFVVCPDRSFEEYSGDGPDIIETELSLGIELCEGFNGLTIDARLFSYNSGTILCSDETTPNITIMNMGSEALVSADVEVYLNEELQSTTNWTGNLALYDFEFVTLPSISLNGVSNPIINVVLSNPNDQTDQNADNDETSVNIEYGGLTYETETLHFQLYFDNFPQETSWEFLNSIGEVVASGDDYMGYPDFSPPIDTEITLPAGDCYTFNIYDDASDGICCAYADEGEGFWKIFTDQEELIAEGGVFVSEESAIFGIEQIVGVSDLELLGLSVHPNPASDQIIIQTNVLNYNWELIGLDGRVVMKGNYNSVGANTINISLIKDSGLYLLRVQTGNLISTKKIFIE